MKAWRYSHSSTSQLFTICLNIGMFKTINFPLGINEKLMVLGVPIQCALVLGHVRPLTFHYIRCSIK